MPELFPVTGSVHFDTRVTTRQDTKERLKDVTDDIETGKLKMNRKN